MKYLSLFLFGLMMVVYIPISAQTSETTKNQKQVDVPEQVTTNFSHEYPQASDAKWIMEDDAFVVSFSTADNGNQKVRYDDAGVKLKEERELDHKTDLPRPVVETLQNRFGSYEIKKVTQESARGITSYRITVDENGVQKQVVINGDGRLRETGIE